MSSDGSVTYWITGLKAGDAVAAQGLWDRYFDHLVRLARNKLRGVRYVGIASDEEDAALSALNCVFHDVADGKFPQLSGRDELWRLLVVVTARKALNQARQGRRQKRGGGQVRGEADLAAAGAEDDDRAALAAVIGSEPTPEFAAMVAEEYQRRLDALEDETLKRVATWRMEGYDLEEIAARLGCATRTVQRKLDRIRKTWLEASRP